MLQAQSTPGLTPQSLTLSTALLLAEILKKNMDSGGANPPLPKKRGNGKCFPAYFVKSVPRNASHSRSCFTSKQYNGNIFADLLI